MWYTWTALLVSCALVVAEVAEVTEVPVATTRSPPRTLDRQADELAWRSWLQSPEDGNQNAPPRRITTKSLFITPLVCPKGHRLDGTACVQVVTVNKDEHERILLQQLQALLPTSQNNGDTIYDYGEEDDGPTLLSIPIGIDPQQDPSGQAQESTNSMKADKKGENAAANIEAELELLKLQQAHNKLNDTQNGGDIMSHNVLHNFLTYSDKPKRDSPMINSSEIETLNNSDEGQKELVFGQVNVDPVLYNSENQNNQALTNETEIEKIKKTIIDNTNISHIEIQNDSYNNNETHSDTSSNTTNLTKHLTKAEAEEAKLNPENDYSDIGEAIKLISRYAEVSTDDNFTKGDKMSPLTDDGILGTRTKLQYRRNKPKPSINLRDTDTSSDIPINNDGASKDGYQLNNVMYYRYPWPSEGSASPPSNYPFHHLQDYWAGRTRAGGVYNTMHENPRRHHHSYPQYFRPRGYQYVSYPDTDSRLQEAYPGLRRYPHKLVEHNTSPIGSQVNNSDLYSLLGLRHWFSSEGATKR